MIKIKIRKEIGKKNYLLLAILAFMALIGVWTLVTELGLVDPIFLPKPMKVVQYYI